MGRAVSDIRALVQEALDNAAQNGYSAEILSAKPLEIANDLLDFDSGIAQAMHVFQEDDRPRLIEPYVKSWQESGRT